MAEDLIVSIVMEREIERQAEPPRPPQPSGGARSVLQDIEDEIAALRGAHAAGDLDLADLLPLLKNARTRLRQAQNAEAEAVSGMAWRGPLITWMTWFNMDLSERRALLGRHLSGVTVAKKVRHGPRPDPERLQMHWLNGKIQTATAVDLTGARWRSAKQAVNGQGLVMTTAPPGVELVEVART